MDSFKEILLNVGNAFIMRNYELVFCNEVKMRINEKIPRAPLKIASRFALWCD